MQKIIITLLLLIFGVSCTRPPKTIENLWPSEIERYWAGPQFLSVPAMDWKLDSGRLVCMNAGGSKGVVLLTKSIEHPEGFEITFEGGFVGKEHGRADKMGLMLGLNTPEGDMIDFQKGIFAGVTVDGMLILMEKTSKMKTTLAANEQLIFNIEGVPMENGKLQLLLRVRNEAGDNQLGEVRVESNGERIKGFISFYVQTKEKASSGSTAWFESLEITGEGVVTAPENAKGPILSIEDSMQNGLLTMKVFLAPLLRDSSNRVVLQIRDGGEWTTLAKEPVPDDYVVTFSPQKLDASVSAYRVYTRYIDRYGSQKYSYVKGSFDRSE